MDVLVREARESELDEIGAVTVEVYGSGLVGPEYLEVLRDTRSRWDAPATTILVALDDGTEGVLGVVVYAGPGSPWQDLATQDEAEIRMLGVLPSARDRGVGEALVRACLARAKAEGLPRVVLSTTLDMKAAHRLYARIGFARAPERDWTPRPGLTLIAYAMEIKPDRAETEAEAVYCGQCGKPLAEGSHEQCTTRAELEPPRFCPQCARRMVVQVLPSGWTARCSRHGSTERHDMNA
jgi:ribosomal protein S18 acetylase RimI-like enzyme